MTDIEFLWQLAEIREIGRRQTEAHVKPLIAIVEAYHDLIEMLLEDQPDLRGHLESMKARIEQYQDRTIDQNGERPT